MQTILTALQPYLNEAVNAAILAICSLAFIGAKKLWSKASALIDARLTDTQRATLHKLAAEAYAYAETKLAGSGGSNKLKAAEDYVSARLQALGFSVTTDDIQSAIHSAWISVGGNIKAEAITATEEADQTAAATASADEAAKAAVDAFKAKLLDLIESAGAEALAGALVTGSVTTTTAEAAAPVQQPVVSQDVTGVVTNG